jgi:hypothetical protein
MSYPENPETVVVRNKFYPKGLREIDVWNHYQKVKAKLLMETKNFDLMVVLMVDENKPVIRRRVEGRTIRLTPQNYDELITGRTVSIHISMGSTSTYGIIDVDLDPRDNFRWAIKATTDTYDFVMDKMPIVKKASMRFTGKSSFHIICDFERRMKVDTMKYLLQKFLIESDISRVYQIGGRRKPGVPNLDLDRNCLRCNHIALHALSIWGLQCMEVPYTKIHRFNPREAIVR